MSTAHIFNGFKNLSLQYAGLRYFIPYGELTKFGDQVFRSPDERNQNHESNPTAGAMFETKRDAIEFFNEILNHHYQGYQVDGVVWVGDHAPTATEQKATMEKGRIKKMQIVEQALADRRSALARGGQPELDREHVEWMVEYDMHDETYNRAPEGGFTKAQLEQVGAIAGAVIAQMTKPQEPAKK